jgi:isocitrate dehydrogenase
MKTVPGLFEGQSVSLLDEAPTQDRSYVLVTFLESHLALAIARKGHTHGDVIRPPQVGAPPAGDTYRRMSVGSLMTRDVVQLPGNAQLSEALQLMRARGITSLVVRPDAGGEWGIVTMRDVLRVFVDGSHPADHFTVGEVATRPLITTSPDESLSDCGRRMIDENIRRLVVWSDDRPVGIISDTDIFLFLAERDWSI